MRRNPRSPSRRPLYPSRPQRASQSKGQSNNGGHTLRRSMIAAIALAAVATAGTGAWAVTRPGVKTPCEAASTIIAGIRADANRGQGAAIAQLGGNFAGMFRGIAAGQYEDVEGAVSPELRTGLLAVAGDLERLAATGGEPAWDEFTPGRLTDTAMDMDAVLAVCGNPAYS